MTKYIIRIEDFYVRNILLLVFWVPLTLTPWLWCVLWNKPGHLLTARPYLLAWEMLLLAAMGEFVGA